MILATILSAGNEQTIGDAVRSALLLADRVLLCDTGIKDRTIEVALRAGGERISVETVQWTGFADARNRCLQAAREMNYQWCLHLDSDETIHLDKPAADVLATIAASPDTACWQIANGDRSYVRERLIRCTSNARWRGRVHETLDSSGPVRILPGVRISGRPKTPQQFRAKLNRDLEALQLETAERPNDARWWYYLGQTLEDLGRTIEAIQAYTRCWSLPGWSEQSAWAAYRAAACRTRQHDFRGALETCIIGLKKDSRFPELAWLAGCCRYQMGNYEQAASHATEALRITDSGVCDQRIGFRYLPGWRDRPKNLLEWCRRKLRSHDSGPRGDPGLPGRPNIIVLGVGHANTSITVRQLHALGWFAGDADREYAESVSIREINHRLLSGQIVPREEMDAALAALPQPWAVKDPRFAYGAVGSWMRAFERYRPLLLWVTKDRNQVLASFARRGENADHLDTWLAYCATQFDAWPWSKLKLDAAEIRAACELWRSKDVL
jgi:tetratricopeptide (TPR) repeat protein